MKNILTNVFTIAVITGIGAAVGLSIAFTQTSVEAQVITKEVLVSEEAPVLERIALCESGGKHYKNGQVVFNANTDGTVDVGKYQINTVWFKKATELGLDITREADNHAMAKWIYSNRGTGDWSASQACWKK